VNINEILPLLQDYGFTRDEAHLYCYLIRMGSATIHEIHSSPDFSDKLRPNLYKIIDNLHIKQFIIEEFKDGKKRFFPIEPEQILEKNIADEETRISNLKEKKNDLIKGLEAMKSGFENPFKISSEYQSFLLTIIPSKWQIKEPPEIRKIPLMGSLYSVEYDTKRRFGANSAGIAINKFAYPEHRKPVFEEVIHYEQIQMENALRNHFNQNSFKLKEFTLFSEPIHLKDNISIPITKFKLKLNIPGTFSGGIATFPLEEFPNLLISVWGADYQDFLLLIEKISEKYHFLHKF
jgi:hypothetical protein